MCPLPNLIHPVPVQISRLQRSSTFVDDDFEEPIENVSRATTVTVQGQVMWQFDKKLQVDRAGSEDDSDGYVLFRTVDLRAAGITRIEVGDQFLQLGGSPNGYGVNVFVVRVHPMGHYQDQGGCTLIRHYFKDRNPAQASGAGLL